MKTDMARQDGMATQGKMITLDHGLVRKEIIAQEEAYVEAALANDPDAMEALLHEECVLINSGMDHVANKRDQVQLLRDGRLIYDHFAPEDVEVSLCGETTAIARSTTTVSVEREGRRIEGQFWITKVYVKDERGWTIISGQSTRIE